MLGANSIRRTGRRLPGAGINRHRGLWAVVSRTVQSGAWSGCSGGSWPGSLVPTYFAGGLSCYRAVWTRCRRRHRRLRHS